MNLNKKSILPIHLIILLVLLFNSTFSIGQNNTIVVATKFIDSLKRVSPKGLHGLPLNKYFITDLNNDDVYEVIERKNKIELEFQGFLPSTISSAFDYDIIYSFERGTFLRESKKFINYFYSKKSHYKFWLEIIKINKTNESDGFKIIRVNNDYFQKELTRLIKLTDKNILEVKFQNLSF